MIGCGYTDQLEELALGGLPEEERLVLQRHLTECAICVEELGDYLEALATIAHGVPRISPRPELRERILSVARSELEASLGSRELPAPRETRQQRRILHLPRVSWLTAAAAAIAAISLGWTVRLSAELDAQRAALAQLNRRYDTVVGVLAAQEVNIQLLAATDAAPGGMGRIFIDKQTGNGMIMHRLPPLAEGQVYQLWFVGAGERASGGVLRSAPDGSGYTLIQVPGPLSHYTEVGVTREPAGGSPWPTGERLLGCAI